MKMSKVTITAGMRTNLLSLQNISKLLATTHNKLATGQKVNSAIDNPLSYYTARSLNNRASDLDSLLDTMGQAIQIIKTANDGIESASQVLEQMCSVTEQTLTEANLVPVSEVSELEDNVAALLERGYTAITASMTIAEVQAILDTDDAKVVLTENVTLNGTISAHGKNIVINGGGHTLTTRGIYNYGAGATIENMKINNTANSTTSFARTIYDTGGNITIRNLDITQNNTVYQTAALELRGTATVENVDISMSGKADQMVGVYAWNTSTVTNVSVRLSGAENSLMAAVGSHSSNVTVKDIGVFADGGTSYGVIGPVKGVVSQAVGQTANRPSSLYNGEANTQAIVGQLGSDASAAYAATQFYVGDKNSADFGQGTWYLPSIGELMDMYGTDTDKMNVAWGSSSGAVGDNKKAVNDALGKLSTHGIAEKLTNNYYWSSSEYYDDSSWKLNMNNGNRGNNLKGNNSYVRCFQLLENCFNPSTLSADGSGGGSGGAAAPKIGDVMYSDKTWGSADDYDSTKTAVGIVTEVSKDGSVKIVNLKDLTFSSPDKVGNFDPDNPYSGSSATTRWSTGSKIYQNVEAVEDVPDFKMLLALNPNASVVSVETLNSEFARVDAETYEQKYNGILNQYDALINDCSYKSVNLLKKDNLKVVFNETGSSSVTVAGQDMSSSGIGLSLADWAEKEGILQSVRELSSALASLRSFSGELGNNYSIISNRQEFTENLINILEEGADALTLADMNEESASMLALKTRQQLALTSLSLASQSSQDILSVF